jgi:hypothetical protein
MVKGTVKAAADSVVNFIRGGPRVDHREPLMVTKKSEEWFVIQPPATTLKKGERVKESALALLRPNLPWINGMNIVEHRGHRRFVDHHIEYDVVHIVFCDMLGLPKGVTPKMALELAGFKFIPLEKHRLKGDIKRVLGIS